MLSIERVLIGLLLGTLWAGHSLAETAYTKRLIIVVSAVVSSACNDESKKVDTVRGDKTFTVGLSETGSSPVTHYWCNWVMTPEDETALKDKLKTWTDLGTVKIYDGNSVSPESVLSKLGLKTIQEGAP